MAIFKKFTFQVANMKKAQTFVIYPYSGNEVCALQSAGRFCRMDIKTGKGIINHKNENYPNSEKLALNPLPFVMPESVLTEIKNYLRDNSGVQHDKNIGLTIVNEKFA